MRRTSSTVMDMQIGAALADGRSALRDCKPSAIRWEVFQLHDDLFACSVTLR